MSNFFGLSEMEYELMQIFWAKEEPLTFPQVVAICNEENGHQWAKTTIHTFLSRMVAKGVLRVENGRKKHIYTALVSSNDLETSYALSFLQDSYGGSLVHFIKAVIRGMNIPKSDAAEIQALLDEP